MKIVQLCPYDLDRPGGVQRHVRDLSDWLTAQGHETRIIAPPTPGLRARQDGPVTQLGGARSIGAHGTAFELSFAGPKALRETVAHLQNWGADVVHMHTPWTPFMVWQVWRKLRLPTVTTFHATLPEAKGAGLMDRYIRRAARHFLTQSDDIIVPSSAPLAMLKAMHPDLRATILPPAVDLGPWRDQPARRDPNRISLTFMGRLEPRKGVDVVLQAWPKIAEALPQAVMTIAGDGEMQDVVQSAIGDRLYYVGRPSDADARQLMAASDFYLAPALYGESYGLVLAEAMTAGAVPVAAANPGYCAMLGPTGAELTVAPGDPVALADKVITLVRDASALDHWRIWSRKHSQSADVETCGPDYLTVFEKVLRGT